MDPLVLYPSKDRLKIATIAAAALVVVPFLIRFSGLAGFIPQFSMWAMFSVAGGGVLYFNVVKAQQTSVPVFAADIRGFSIRGGRKLPWDQFKGADTFPFDTAIKIGTGESKLRPNVEIKTLELSGPAREMVSQIEEYAANARRAAMMGGAVTLGGKHVSRQDVVPPTLEEVSGFGAAVASAPEQIRYEPFTKGALAVPPMGKSGAGLLPIELFPSDVSRIKGIALGLVLLFFAHKMARVSQIEQAIGVVWLLGGLGVFGLGASIWSYLRPKPSFSADIEGFSVRGKGKKSWDEFRSIGVHTVRYWFIPVTRSVVIKTGKSVIGGRQHIPFHLMNGSAKEMVAEISQYARAVQLERERDAANAMQRAAVVMARASQQSTLCNVETHVQKKPLMDGDRRDNSERTRPVGMAQRTRRAEPKLDPSIARVKQSDDAIQTVPSMAERIFGRRKVR